MNSVTDTQGRRMAFWPVLVAAAGTEIVLALGAALIHLPIREVRLPVAPRPAAA